jgi:hypothetical protein
MVRELDATLQPPPQDHQLMSKRRVLSFKPQPRLERRGQDGQNETEKPDHPASLGDSVTSSTRTRFSVHTGRNFLRGVLEDACRAIGADSQIDEAHRDLTVDSDTPAVRTTVI